jgi:ABC-2 type transport system permease protein
LVGISLLQPVIWLLLFGALSKRPVDIPGFSSGSYIEFLTPGVVVMLAVSAAGWVGMGFIEDINRGTMDRLLVSPIWRGALNLGSVAQSVLSIVVQSVIVIALALAVGARFHNGLAGVAVLLAVAGLLGAVFASLSNGVAVLTRQRETLIRGFRQCRLGADSEPRRLPRPAPARQRRLRNPRVQHVSALDLDTNQKGELP